jgi:hypothetical protein
MTLARVECGEQTILPPLPSDDYRQFINGGPRFDGVCNFLASRGIAWPRDGNIAVA